MDRQFGAKSKFEGLPSSCSILSPTPPITNQEHNTGLVSADGGVSGGAHHTILGRHADVPPVGYKGKKRPFKRTIKRPDTSIFRLKSMPDSATENVPPLSNTSAAASATGNKQAQLLQQQ